MSPNDDDELLTVAEVAKRLHISSRTVNRWILDGILPAKRLPSGRYRVRRADVEAALRDT